MRNMFISGSCIEPTPEWYWEDDNIADSEIIKVEYFNGSKQCNGYRHVLKIYLNTDYIGSNMKSITFYDCKVECEKNDITGRWILEERLYHSGNKYELKMIITSIKKQFLMKIQFKYAEAEYKTSQRE